jgi:hypothetical protein
VEDDPLCTRGKHKITLNSQTCNYVKAAFGKEDKHLFAVTVKIPGVTKLLWIL